MNRKREGTELLTRSFGPLEVEVMETIWRERRKATVRDLHASFPRLAYTTLMTTLDRLYTKGVLSRTKVGRAFAYEAALRLLR